MSIRTSKVIEIQDELELMLYELPSIRRVHQGDPRKDLEVPAVILEFDFPETSAVSIGGLTAFPETGRTSVEYGFVTTFCFDDRNPRESNREWSLVGVELVNSVLGEWRHVEGLWINLRVDNVLTPEHIVTRERGNPTMFKSTRLVAESEER